MRSLSSLSSLRREHGELNRRAMRLRQMLAQPAPPPELLTERRIFADLLHRHLLAEDELVYPVLIGDDAPEVAGVAAAFVEELGGLAKTWRDYCVSWDEDAIARGWRDFGNATNDLLDLLAIRILREERILYPLAERGHSRKAA